MRIITYLLWIILLIAGVSFALLNSQHLPLNYFIGKTSIYFPLLVLLLLFVGSLLGILAILPVVIRSKAKMHHLKTKMKALEQEITNLRNIPIKDSH